MPFSLNGRANWTRIPKLLLSDHTILLSIVWGIPIMSYQVIVSGKNADKAVKAMIDRGLLKQKKKYRRGKVVGEILELSSD
jgi:hypothetical protein